MAFIIGKKVGMSQIFAEDGTVTPVTVIQAAPMKATLVRTAEKNGYSATQFEYPKQGKKMGKREFPATAAIGDTIDLSTFKIGDVVKVSGVSKAKGFQGAVKRHGFAGLPASHGHHHVMRHVGSIGQRFPQHTLKGMRMAGRTGGRNTTVRGLKVVSIDVEKNQMMVKGAVPGRRGTLVTVVTL